ncbi:YihY/virulence factor BrkB family protein [Thiohalomonas denitrificans]|uniref:YihY/virulence factor BrkB family protein n=1 Tax=Thiohalomonas denitrificans TaxID=415747 RepID=UPI0026E9D3D8|nr:YihY/virulence factor BrkB family protein [Thiohalomonas denitrificans]
MLSRLFGHLWDFLFRDLWQVETEQLSRPRRWGIYSLRVAYVLVRDLQEGALALRAMSLVYTTLLSLVPLLAVSFSVLKAFGVHNQIEPLLLNVLAPLGEQGVEITNRIIGFVENIQVGVLGSVGLAFLVYTVISLIQKIEESFNFVWHIKQVRSISRRFSDYLSVIIIGPVLVFTAIGVTASVMNNAIVQALLEMEPFGTVVVVLGRLVPYLLITAAFTFVYMFVPNTSVRLRSALVGGVVGGGLWQLTGYAFAAFASGSTRYDAIYSGFAILIMFMIWLYLSWFILLFGAKVAYYHQHPQQVRREAERIGFSNRLRERAGLLVMYLVTRAYERGEEGWTLDALSQRLGLPGDSLGDLLLDMERVGLLIETGIEDPKYFPGRDPAELPVREVLAQLRAIGESGYPLDRRALSVGPIDEVLEVTETAVREKLGEVTIKDLARQERIGL